MSRPLTFKQKGFVAHYQQNGGNATQAALAVYDTSYNTARVMGSENLAKSAIQAEIRRIPTNFIGDALGVVADALHATTANGRPDHRIRLDAAKFVLRMAAQEAPAQQTPIGSGPPGLVFPSATRGPKVHPRQQRETALQVGVDRDGRCAGFWRLPGRRDPLNRIRRFSPTSSSGIGVD